MALAINDPRDWKTDPTTGDLVVPIVYVSGLEGLAQLIRQAIQLLRGEWFLNRLDGIPLLENEFVAERDALIGRPFDAARARADYRRTLISIEGVNAIRQLDVAFEGETRAMTVTWSVDTVFGVPLSATQEFVIP